VLSAPGAQVAPSILSADFSRLGSQVSEVLEAGARVIHVDVMDGHFVPPITIGPMIAASIADLVHDAGGLVDVHLMVARPADHIEEFARAGADCISFHVEADPHAHRTATAIREAGCLVGLAINPGTAANAAAELAEQVDMLLCMSVNPGWGGQAFIASTPDKVRQLRELAPGAAVEVDGGVDADTAPAVAAAGAGVLVAGSAVFKAADPAEAFARISEAAASKPHPGGS